ncbi:MAG: S-layer homology domain-containing protein [Candidatus Riflebacteria bacterium]|nr:S-layer homology domain-containing protein [Candidatus Riflebacteria bacterium]
MKNTSIFASAAMILATAAIATANPFSDVPASHWAYDAVNSMAEKGIIQGFPDGTFKGKQNVTRYQLAMITAKMIANVEQMGGNGSVSKTDLQTLEKLTVEFADELALLGVKVTALEDDMQVVKEDVAGLKKDVDGIKTYMKNGGMDKVKLSGDILVRNYGYANEPKNGMRENHDHRTETMLRLQLDAQIDENVTARARWNMIDNNRGNEWNGQNKNTADVEVAYIQIKDMFSFGGDFKFGRDWYQHGHGFIVHNYMDAVNYTKRCGDVDVALNVFFERDGMGNDYFNIWNINADYSTKGHDIYLGIYYNDRYTGINTANKNDMRIEFGASGKLSNNNDKVKYDLGLVHSKREDMGANGSDLSGMLGHVAVKYDDQKQLQAKLAYTFADDESWANIDVENSNRYHDGDETIFEDLYLASYMGLGARNTNLRFYNLNDLKLEVKYTLKDNDKHSFRLAYDNITNKDDNKGNTFADRAGGAFNNDLKANIITFEYTYKLAENTRLRLGYQNSKIEGNTGVAGAAAVGMDDVKTDLYYTEIYSRF